MAIQESRYSQKTPSRTGRNQDREDSEPAFERMVNGPPIMDVPRPDADQSGSLEISYRLSLLYPQPLRQESRMALSLEAQGLSET